MRAAVLEDDAHQLRDEVREDELPRDCLDALNDRLDIQILDALTIAHAATLLGAGRERKGDSIDLSVGVVLDMKLGDGVSRGQPLATLHANDQSRLAEAEAADRAAGILVDYVLRCADDTGPMNPLMSCPRQRAGIGSIVRQPPARSRAC